MTKKRKSVTRKRKSAKDLALKDARRVKGGATLTVRKAGEKPVEY